MENSKVSLGATDGSPSLSMERLQRYPEFVVVMNYFTKSRSAETKFSREFYKKKMNKALDKLYKMALREEWMRALQASIRPVEYQIESEDIDTTTTYKL